MSKTYALTVAAILSTSLSFATPKASAFPPMAPTSTYEVYSDLIDMLMKKIYENILAEKKTLPEIEKEAESSNPPAIDADEKTTAPEQEQKPNEALKVNRQFIEQWLKEGVPHDALKKAIAYIERDKKGVINNRLYLTIIDFTAPSTTQRMFLLNLETGEFQKSFAAHGAKSGGLKATKFNRSNKVESNQTTPGFHKLGEIYNGRHGLSYRLDGLESRNSKARDKNVVIHGAKYATTTWVKRYGWLGRSQGCPAVSPDTMRKLLNKKLSGTLLYNYTELDKTSAKK